MSEDSVDYIFGRGESSSSESEGEEEVSKMKGTGGKIRRWIKTEGVSIKKSIERAKKAAR